MLSVWALSGGEAGMVMSPLKPTLTTDGAPAFHVDVLIETIVRKSPGDLRQNLPVLPQEVLTRVGSCSRLGSPPNVEWASRRRNRRRPAGDQWRYPGKLGAVSSIMVTGFCGSSPR